jgi:4-hydroxybenzoate polyprenyltransferase
VALLHPGPSAATVLAAGAFAGLFARGRPPPGRLALLLGMAAAQQGAVALHNDWCDRDLDAVAKPWRAIPRGAVPAAGVRRAAWALAGGSAGLALALGRGVLALNVASTAAAFAYSARLKRTAWSWLPFAVAFPMLPLFGAAALRAWPPRWWSLFVVGAPAVVAIHLADTLPDLETDAAGGVRGLAHRLGARGTRRASLGALGLVGAAVGGVGLAGGSRAAAAGGALGLGLGGLALARPATHRLAVEAGATAAALGWVAALARLDRRPREESA